jgi:CubicO group peptidase (beta-lactamase class C family)
MQPDHVDSLRDLETFVDDRRRRLGVPGLAVVAVAGNRFWSYAGGVADLANKRPFTVDTTAHWFSMTKIVAVTAALRLVDRGDLDLDAPVDSVAPGLLPTAFSAVKVRHLAQHSAGFTNPLPLRWVRPAGQPLPDQRAFVESLVSRQRKPAFAPGTSARYSNVSTMVLGEVIAQVSGQPFVDHVTEHILDPLAMTRTAFVYTPAMQDAAIGYVTLPRPLTPLLRRFLPDGIVGPRHGRCVAFRDFEMDAVACSGLIGSVTDAGRFAAMHIKNGDLDGVRILQPATTAAMREITLEGKPYDMGLGWFRSRRGRNPPLRYVEHLGGGGGFFNTMRLYPDLEVAVVVMGNTTKHYDVGSIADPIAAALRAGG